MLSFQDDICICVFYGKFFCSDAFPISLQMYTQYIFVGLLYAVGFTHTHKQTYKVCRNSRGSHSEHLRWHKQALWRTCIEIMYNILCFTNKLESSIQPLPYAFSSCLLFVPPHQGGSVGACGCVIHRQCKITATENLTVVLGSILSLLPAETTLICVMHVPFHSLGSDTGAHKTHLKAAPPQGILQYEK